MSITAGRETIVPDDIEGATFVDLEIGSFCSIASGLTIVSGQHPAVDAPEAVSNFPFFEHGWGDYPRCRLGGKVLIAHDVWIGQNVTIMEGVEVHSGATLAACSVVTRDVPPYAVVAGNPAQVVKMRFAPLTIKTLLRLAWWHWSDESIKASLPDMANVNEFLSCSRL